MNNLLYDELVCLMLQCVAACLCELQCVAVCCSVLQVCYKCVANVLHVGAASELQVCCKCAAVCCSVLQCIANVA